MAQTIYKCVQPDMYRLKFSYPENCILYAERLALTVTNKDVDLDSWGISKERFEYVYERVLRWCVRKDKREEIICIMRDFFKSKRSLSEVANMYGLTDKGIIRLVRWATRRAIYLLNTHTINGVFDESAIPVYCRPEYSLRCLDLSASLEELLYAKDSPLTNRMYNTLTRAGYSTAKEVYNNQDVVFNIVGFGTSCYSGLVQSFKQMGYPLDKIN